MLTWGLPMSRSFVHDRTAKPQRDAAVSQLQRTPGHPRSIAQRILELQGTIGNQAVGQFLRGTDRMLPSTLDRPSGEPLEPAMRMLMEARLGHDFSRVRVHTDQTAAQAAHRVDAQAF